MQFWLLAAGLALLIGAGLLLSLLLRVEVRPGAVALVYRRGVFVAELPPGHHRVFGLPGALRIEHVSLQPRALMAQQLDVISKDQFSFRLSVTPLVTIVDARAFAEAQPPAPPGAHAAILAHVAGGFSRLIPLLAAAVLEAAARHDLDAFLADPHAALAGVEERLAPALPGTRLDQLALTAITLPPETRKMFTEVERARREGLAVLERARAEQASLRALANAARMLADNPELGRLRLLQAVEGAKGAKTFILGEASPAAAAMAPRAD